MVSYPVENGEFVNMVAMIRNPSQWTEDSWTVEATDEEFSQYCEGWYPPLIDVFSRHRKPVKWALFVVKHDAPYFKGRMCLLGDSAHATTPHLGAGAGMAMEDAYILSSLIASVAGTDEIENAFQAYDAVRRPRTQSCIERSEKATLGYGLSLLNVGDDIMALKKHVQESYKWLWHENLEEQLSSAKELLHHAAP